MAEKMMAIVAKTINGEILEFPTTYYFPCNKVQPQGEAIIRDFDDNFCIVARKVYLVVYGGDVFGTTQFDTWNEFQAYKAQSCSCCGQAGCTIRYNSCDLIFNDCILMYKN